MSVLIATKVSIHYYETIVAFMVFALDFWHIKFMVMKLIDLVEYHGTFETNFTQSLKTTFDTDVTSSTSPADTTIRLPTCNVTP